MGALRRFVWMTKIPLLNFAIGLPVTLADATFFADAAFLDFTAFFFKAARFIESIVRELQANRNRLVGADGIEPPTFAL